MVIGPIIHRSADLAPSPSSSLNAVQSGNDPQKAQNATRAVMMETVPTVLAAPPIFLANASKQILSGCSLNGLVM